jgi:uncharacterized protein (DUF1919 family)
MEICWSLGKLTNISIHFCHNIAAHSRKKKGKRKTKLTKQSCGHEKRGKDRNALNKR